MTTLLDLKLDRAFGHIDVNAHGYIDHDDIVALVARLIAGFRESPGSEKGQAVAAGFEDFWKSVVGAVDTDGDGRIGIDEFKVMQKAFGTKPRGVKAAFRHLDADGDGALSVPELIEAAREYYTGRGGAAGDWLFGPLA